MSELKPVLDLVTRHFPWVVPMFASLFALRVFLMKFINAPLQAKLTQMLADAAARKDALEDSDIERVLGARWYRVAAWGLDAVVSLKLPHRTDFLRMLEAQNTQTQN